MVVREKFCLVRGHVHADGTFRFAGFARKTEIQRALDLIALPSARDYFATQHLEQQVSATARRMLLVASRHVARAHGAFIGLPAFADADAPKRRARDASFYRKRKERAGCVGLIT